MDIGHRERTELAGALETAIGGGPAGTLMALLPPVDGGRVATKPDLDALEGRLEQRMGHLEQRMDRIEQRMDRIEQRMDHLEQRMDQLVDVLAALSRDVAVVAAIPDTLRAEWRQDLSQVLYRQTIIQLGGLLAILIAAFTLAERLG